MKYFKKLEGEHIYLSPYNVEDTPQFTKWLNDFGITDYIGKSGEMVTLEWEKEYLESHNNKPKEQYNFEIIQKEKSKPIGSCGLEKIDRIHRKAVLGIFIGDKEEHNKGYGTEIVNLLLDYGFNYLNLHSIKLDVLAFNKRAIKCYEKCGFKECGRQREAYYLNGKYYDIMSMDILKKEYEGNYIKNKNI